MEAEIGRFRRRHLVPVPKTATLAELNERIGAADLLEDTRVITRVCASTGRVDPSVQTDAAAPGLDRSRPVAARRNSRQGAETTP